MGARLPGPTCLEGRMISLQRYSPEGCEVLLLRCGAHNSAVECHLHTVEVVGSNPAVPTINHYK